MGCVAGGDRGSARAKTVDLQFTADALGWVDSERV